MLCVILNGALAVARHVSWCYYPAPAEVACSPHTRGGIKPSAVRQRESLCPIALEGNHREILSPEYRLSLLAPCYRSRYSLSGRLPGPADSRRRLPSRPANCGTTFAD